MRLKYMGMSHVHLLEAGDDFGGRLAEGIPQSVRFDRSNNWVVDTETVGLSEAAVEVLLSDQSFKNVTGMERIPLNRHQTTFLGMRDGDSEPDPNAPAEEEPQYEYAAPVDPDEQAKRDAVAAEQARLDAEAQAAADNDKVSATGKKKS